mgnify:CR=1 FL=1
MRRPPATAGRGARLKRKLTAAALESWTIESSSSKRQQPNSERRTRSSTHTVNLPLLPAETANDAYGPQNSEDRTSLAPESSFLIQQEIGWLFASLSRQPTLPQQQQPAAAVLADGCEKSQGHSAGMLASRNS